MAFEITGTDIWTGEVPDQRGALADQLEAILRAGADLDFVIVRPAPERLGTGILYVAPLHGPEQTRAAEEVGLRRSASMHTLRVIGPDRPGLVAGIARTLDEAGLNISGLTAGRLSERCVAYIRFESEEEVTKAAQVLTPMLG